MDMTRRYPNNIVPKGTSIEQGFRNDDAELKDILHQLDEIRISIPRKQYYILPKRNTILHGARHPDNTAAWLEVEDKKTISINTTTPLILTFAAGWSSEGPIDYSYVLNSSQDNTVINVQPKSGSGNHTGYIFLRYDPLSNTCALDDSPCALISSKDRPEAKEGQYWYDTIQGKMHHYDAAGWQDVCAIYMGEYSACMNQDVMISVSLIIADPEM
jgi:hypothetical protein